MTRSVRAVKLLYCYAREDRALLEELESHLEPLKRSGQIITWHDQEIQPGAEWRREIDAHLNGADLILLLLSHWFMHSDNCCAQMNKALERHESGEARVIPIILRPVYWEGTASGELQALPSGGRPVTLWRSHHAAFLNVARGISEVVNVLLSQAAKMGEESHVSESRVSRDAQCYSDVLFQLIVWMWTINWLYGTLLWLWVTCRRKDAKTN